MSREYERNCVVFSGETGELDFYKTGTDKVFVDPDNDKTWYELPSDEMKEVAYVLCAPVADVDDDQEDEYIPYTLIVETRNRTVEVPVRLFVDGKAFRDDTMRHQFTLNLTFKMGSKIAVSTAITDWVAGGMGIENLDPN